MMTRNQHRQRELEISIKYKPQFQAGVTSILRSWSALKTAVEQQWGGIESSAKAEDLRRNIFEAFDLSSSNNNKQKVINVFDLQDNIFLYMEEEFSVVLEDDSDKQVSEMIYRLYESCCKNEDLSFYKEVMELENRVNKCLPKDNKVMMKVEGELDEDSDDDEDNMEEDDVVMTDDDTNNVVIQNNISHTTNNMEEYVSAPLFASSTDNRTKKKKNIPIKPARQLGEEEEPQKVEPIEVDEDGFATVTTKSTRRSRRSKN